MSPRSCLKAKAPSNQSALYRNAPVQVRTANDNTIKMSKRCSIYVPAWISFSSRHSLVTRFHKSQRRARTTIPSRRQNRNNRAMYHIFEGIKVVQPPVSGWSIFRQTSSNAGPFHLRRPAYRLGGLKIPGPAIGCRTSKE